MKKIVCLILLGIFLIGCVQEDPYQDIDTEAELNEWPEFIECESEFDCSHDEICENNECVLLECGECEQQFMHSCVEVPDCNLYIESYDEYDDKDDYPNLPDFDDSQWRTD